MWVRAWHSLTRLLACPWGTYILAASTLLWEIVDTLPGEPSYFLLEHTNQTISLPCSVPRSISFPPFLA